MGQLDPSKAKRDEAKAKSKKVLGRLGVEDLELTEYESIIAAEIIQPADIEVGFDDVGGLDHIIDSLRESVIFPLTHGELFQSASGLYSPPKGCLLYGPPGCGKTLLAKALAKESNATFVNMKVGATGNSGLPVFKDAIQASVLQDKWYGESNKLVAALFSLARKLQPSIIFIDEIDSFMRERARTDHEVSALMKAEFMSTWDGLTTTKDARILVLGATNRPNDIDDAILRRMPKRFLVRLPSRTQRKSILTLLLRDVALDADFDLDLLAQKTEGLSGSDLKELCRNAAGAPIREQIRALSKRSGDNVQRQIVLRPLSMSDFAAPSEDQSHNLNGGALSEPLD